MDSELCSHHILGLIFVRSVSLSDKIGILYLLFSALSDIVWLLIVCVDCSEDIGLSSVELRSVLVLSIVFLSVQDADCAIK